MNRLIDQLAEQNVWNFVLLFDNENNFLGINIPLVYPS